MEKENQTNWVQILGDGERYYQTVMQQTIGGRPSSDELIKDIPTYAVGCLRCGKMNPLAERLRNCSNCSSAEFTFGGNPSQVAIDCRRCGQEIMRSIECDCGCVNTLNQVTLHKSNKSSGACFIATAAYGSHLASEVIVFSRFRDEVLLKSRFGTAFTQTYYVASPPFAQLISEFSFLRRVARRVVLGPLLKLVKRYFNSTT